MRTAAVLYLPNWIGDFDLYHLRDTNIIVCRSFCCFALRLWCCWHWLLCTGRVCVRVHIPGAEEPISLVQFCFVERVVYGVLVAPYVHLAGIFTAGTFLPDEVRGRRAAQAARHCRTSHHMQIMVWPF